MRKSADPMRLIGHVTKYRRANVGGARWQWRGFELTLMRLPASGAELATSLPQGGSGFYLAHVSIRRFKPVEHFDIKARRLARLFTFIYSRATRGSGTTLLPSTGLTVSRGRGARSSPKNSDATF